MKRPDRQYLHCLAHRIEEAVTHPIEIRLYPDEDMLYLGLADAESVEGVEVAEGVVFHYDRDERIVSIEIDEASHRVHLDGIHQHPELVAGDAGPPRRVLTTVEAAAELGLTRFAVQKIRKAMKAAGIQLGIRPDLPGSLLSEEDLARIKTWRAEHPRGRPKSAAIA